MGKRVGFWFYTGDWMKDPELRFCSIFARGLLVDLLCLMFEAKRQGELSKPDGSPRSDEEIVDCVSGSDRATKLAALKELINSGALKRDENTGVLVHDLGSNVISGTKIEVAKGVLGIVASKVVKANRG